MTPNVDGMVEQLAKHPASEAARLRSPSGPLSAMWPAVAGPLDGAPVWVLRIDLDPASGRIHWDGVLAWTAPAAVDQLVLRLPAAELGAEVRDLQVDGRSARLDRDLLRIQRHVDAGETVAVRLSGTTIAGTPHLDGQPDRLYRFGNATILAGWLPLPTPCRPDGWCDAVPWPHVSDPGGFQSMVFVARVTVPRRQDLTLLHPGAEWDLGPTALGIAAVGVRELPLVGLTSWDVKRFPGSPEIRVWSEGGAIAPMADEVGRFARGAVDDFSGRYGPLSLPRVDLVLGPVSPPGSAAELPGMILLSPQVVPEEGECLIVSHEVAHQWWYGEVGSDALGEPWVDESLAEWSSVDHCRRVDPTHADKSLAFDRASTWPTRAGAPAASLGDAGWCAVYAWGAAFYDDLSRPDPAALDATLRSWLTLHRWGFTTGAELRAALGKGVGPQVVDPAWALWMAP